MEITPAHIDQIRRGDDGRMYTIDADVGGVAADLQDIDPGLKVKWHENGNPPYYSVRYESEDRRSQQLILTAMELDQRIVERVRQIDSHGTSGYNYADELEKQDRKVREGRRAAFREKMGPVGEQAAHALRKDLGLRYKGRAFVPKDMP